MEGNDWRVSGYEVDFRRWYNYDWIKRWFGRLNVQVTKVIWLVNVLICQWFPANLHHFFFFVDFAYFHLRQKTIENKSKLIKTSRKINFVSLSLECAAEKSSTWEFKAWKQDVKTKLSRFNHRFITKLIVNLAGIARILSGDFNLITLNWCEKQQGWNPFSMTHPSPPPRWQLFLFWQWWWDNHYICCNFYYFVPICSSGISMKMNFQSLKST